MTISDLIWGLIHGDRRSIVTYQRQRDQIGHERETARQFVIEKGAAFYKDTLNRYGVATFSELPRRALADLAAESSHWYCPEEAA